MKVPTQQLTSEVDGAAGLAAGCAAALAAVENRQEAAKGLAAGWAGQCQEVAERWTAELQGSHSHKVRYDTQAPAVSQLRAVIRTSIMPSSSNEWGAGLHQAAALTVETTAVVLRTVPQPCYHYHDTAPQACPSLQTLH
jgi:hypothetical protein